MICAICGKEPIFQWTDTHGVAVDSRCGAPYTLYFYDPVTKLREEGREPELALNETGKVLAIRYWQEKQRMVFPMAYDMGRTSLGERSYSGASDEDERLFFEWYKTQPEAGKPLTEGGDAQT